MDKVGLGGRPGSPLFSLYHNSQPYLGQPPPAHMGISPYHLDSKAGLRSPVYPFATSSQYPYSLGAADLTAAQMAAASWLSPNRLMHPHPGLSPPLTHPLVASPKTELYSTNNDPHSLFPYHLTPIGSPRHPSMDQKQVLGQSHKSTIETKNGEKKPNIKKPLNAFMLYMKANRAKVGAECMLKESAAINQILGRKWHALSKDEQFKYYEIARKERQLHMQMYPEWNARDNYGAMKRKKRKKEKTGDGANMKKCRARYSLDQQNQWCKPCRLKKKCIRYMEGEDGDDAVSGSGESHEMTTDSLDYNDVDELKDMSLSSPSTYLGHRDHQMLSPTSSPHLPSPGPSLASPSEPPSFLMHSPSSLASPLSPEDERDQQFHQIPQQSPLRPPVGTNPHDINNPLSVNQLTGQCTTTKSMKVSHSTLPDPYTTPLCWTPPLSQPPPPSPH
ncbi:unnamed protein product [Meganyctiphanes norvegica]|uniref:dTCF n=1 Tax=Meganyctiphanes norvegica TaxID=48144 RepID=A0AAV2PVJ1_MEGNR